VEQQPVVEQSVAAEPVAAEPLAALQPIAKALTAEPPSETYQAQNTVEPEPPKADPFSSVPAEHREAFANAEDAFFSRSVQTTDRSVSSDTKMQIDGDASSLFVMEVRTLCGGTYRMAASETTFDSSFTFTSACGGNTIDLGDAHRRADSQMRGVSSWCDDRYNDVLTRAIRAEHGSDMAQTVSEAQAYLSQRSKGLTPVHVQSESIARSQSPSAPPQRVAQGR
jgi:hypothetical protein